MDAEIVTCPCFFLILAVSFALHLLLKLHSYTLPVLFSWSPSPLVCVGGGQQVNSEQA